MSGKVFTLKTKSYDNYEKCEFIIISLGNKRLEKPASCPDKLYEIMKHCWKWNPDHRNGSYFDELPLKIPHLKIPVVILDENR